MGQRTTELRGYSGHYGHDKVESMLILGIKWSWHHFSGFKGDFLRFSVRSSEDNGLHFPPNFARKEIQRLLPFDNAINE